MSFHNYFKFQEKTTRIINDCQNTNEKFITSIKCFYRIEKNNILANNQSLDDINLFNLNDKTNTFINGVKQENGNFQKFALGKIKLIEDKFDSVINDIKSENMNFIKQQNENMN